MKNLKYLIIILIALSSIIVGCKRKSNIIHFSGHVFEDGTSIGLAGADIYLCAISFDPNNPTIDTVARVKSGANAGYDISAIKDDKMVYAIYSAKDGYAKNNNSDIYYPDQSLEYKDINLYLYPMSFLQLHFQCISNDSIVGTFHASELDYSFKDFTFKNNCDTTFNVEIPPYYSINIDVPIIFTRNGAYNNITYPIQFKNLPHDTTKMNILIK